MKALSIMQPWPFLILRPDVTDEAEREKLRQNQDMKDIENRDWRSDNPALKYRGEFLIHTGLNPDRKFDADWCAETFGVSPPPDLPHGGIVGIAEIVDCVKESESPWFFGRYGFVLRNARPLEFRPCVGQLGFFTPNYDLQYKVKPPKKIKIPMIKDESEKPTFPLLEGVK